MSQIKQTRKRTKNSDTDKLSILDAIDQIVKDKGLSTDMIISFLEEGLIKAYKKNYSADHNVEIIFDKVTGEFNVYSVFVVAEEVIDNKVQISLKDAKLISPLFEVGDIVKQRVVPKDFGRVAAQTAMQVVMTKIKEAENAKTYGEFSELKDTIVNAVVHRVSHGIVFFTIGKTEVMMLQNDQNPAETYTPGSRFKVVVVDVKHSGKGPSIHVSRTHPLLVRKLFELEVPELASGEVKIINVSREAGVRTKISVYAENEDIDPVGALIGPKFKRVQNIVDELRGEKIDVIEWDENPAILISNALSPAKVLRVEVYEGGNTALVVVPNDQLSLAIGREGQNVRLAARLTNWRIDIKDEDQYIEYLKEIGEYEEVYGDY